jgi:hypothetical protein
MQNNLETLHHQAMELVDRSILAKRQGDDAGSLELLREAIDFREEASPTAANLVADQLDFEPLATGNILVAVSAKTVPLSESEFHDRNALHQNLC